MPTNQLKGAGKAFATAFAKVNGGHPPDPRQFFRVPQPALAQHLALRGIAPVVTGGGNSTSEAAGSYQNGVASQSNAALWTIA